jgi:hypothetical protein
VVFTKLIEALSQLLLCGISNAAFTFTAKIESLPDTGTLQPKLSINNIFGI